MKKKCSTERRPKETNSKEYVKQGGNDKMKTDILEQTRSKTTETDGKSLDVPGTSPSNNEDASKCDDTAKKESLLKKTKPLLRNFLKDKLTSAQNKFIIFIRR